MNETSYIWRAILIMAASTYAVRVIPMILFKRRINSVFIQSFLHYVPYSVLTAMTFPVIFTCTGSLAAGIAATAAACTAAYYEKGLMIVAAAAAITALALRLLTF